MSDLPEVPLPPSAGSPPPPPPPPPPPSGLIGPASPNATSFVSAPVQRVGGLATAASIMCVVSAVGLVLTAALQGASRADAEQFLDGEIDESEFVSAVTPYALVTFVQSIAVLATVVLVIVWMHRLAANLRKIDRTGTWGPGWAIGGWFLPPMLYIIPFLMFRDLWHGSDPDVPVGANWRSTKFPPFLTAWFVLYSIAPLVLLIGFRDQTLTSLGGAEAELARHIAGSSTSAWLSAVVGVAGAAAFVGWCRALTARHQRFIGEAAG